MTRTIAALGLLLCLGVPCLWGTGCGATVGDACVDDTDCGRGMYCEASLPGGYCTRKDCERQGCPEDGVCVVFEPGVSFCMFACETAADCREDEAYSCIEGYGPHPFCNVPNR